MHSRNVSTALSPIERVPAQRGITRVPAGDNRQTSRCPGTRYARFVLGCARCVAEIVAVAWKRRDSRTKRLEDQVTHHGLFRW